VGSITEINFIIALSSLSHRVCRRVACRAVFAVFQSVSGRSVLPRRARWKGRETRSRALFRYTVIPTLALIVLYRF